MRNDLGSMMVADHEGREVGRLFPMVPGFFGMEYEEATSEASLQEAIGRLHCGWYGWDADGREAGPTAACACPHFRAQPQLPCPFPTCHAGEQWRKQVHEPGLSWQRTFVEDDLGGLRWVWRELAVRGAADDVPAQAAT